VVGSAGQPVGCAEASAAGRKNTGEPAMWSVLPNRRTMQRRSSHHSPAANPYETRYLCARARKEPPPRHARPGYIRAPVGRHRLRRRKEGWQWTLLSVSAAEGGPATVGVTGYPTCGGKTGGDADAAAHRFHDRLLSAGTRCGREPASPATHRLEPTDLGSVSIELNLHNSYNLYLTGFLTGIEWPKIASHQWNCTHASEPPSTVLLSSLSSLPSTVGIISSCSRLNAMRPSWGVPEPERNR